MNIRFYSGEELQLPSASLAGARLDGLILRRATFDKSDVSNTSCVNTNFDGASLKGTTFTNANLTAANLNNSDVANAIFTNCRLQDCILTCNNIETAVFTGSVYNDNTVWPAGFDPEKAGCIKV